MQSNDVHPAVGQPSRSRQRGSQERLTEALIRTQDVMDALRALIGVPVDSLDDTKALTMMLTEALELTNSDCAVLIISGETLIVGSDTLATGLQHRMVPADVVDGAPQPIDFPSGAAVVVALDDGDAPAALGFARGSDHHYSTGDLQLIDAVVAATDKLLTLARMYREGIARATIEREHQLASTLAQAVLPAGPPKLAGVELFAKVIPADVAGGDFIAFEHLRTAAVQESRPPFVLVTGIVDDPAASGRFDEVDAYLTKPISTRALRACLHDVLPHWTPAA